MFDSIRNFFPDWEQVKPGNWSEHGKVLQYGVGDRDFIEIGLYREPMDGGEYEGSYTLQIFDGDNVIFCAMVE